MNIIINEYQYSKILLEGKKATIYHKAAAGTTNQEALFDGTFNSNDKKINLYNFLKIPSNKLKPNQSLLYDSNNNIGLYLTHDKNKVSYVKADGEITISLLKNMFIIP